MAKKTARKRSKTKTKTKARSSAAKRPVSHAAAPRAAAGPSPRLQFLDVFRKEHATTMKLLSHFPSHQQAFKPHERSGSALQLAWTFAVEQQVGLMAVRKALKLGGGFPPPPPTFADAVAAFDRGARELESELAKAPDSRMSETQQFFTGPKQTGDVRIADILWLMLMDQVHHRGQLSVYTRMAGGKVPSIYGPSADEPWT